MKHLGATMAWSPAAAARSSSNEQWKVRQPIPDNLLAHPPQGRAELLWGYEHISMHTCIISYTYTSPYTHALPHTHTHLHAHIHEVKRLWLTSYSLHNTQIHKRLFYMFMSRLDLSSKLLTNYALEGWDMKTLLKYDHFRT